MLSKGQRSPRGLSVFGPLPSWKLDPYSLVWALCRTAAGVGTRSCETSSRRLLRLTVTVSCISGLSCARWLLGYNDGGADGKHP